MRKAGQLRGRSPRQCNARSRATSASVRRAASSPPSPEPPTRCVPWTSAWRQRRTSSKAGKASSRVLWNGGMGKARRPRRVPCGTAVWARRQQDGSCLRAVAAGAEADEEWPRGRRHVPPGTRAALIRWATGKANVQMARWMPRTARLRAPVTAAHEMSSFDGWETSSGDLTVTSRSS